MARVLHFEVLCRASGYDPSLLFFRRFLRLAKNGDCFTFEASKVDTCLISSMVTTLGAWKDRFFWVSDSILPFKMVWGHPDAIRQCPSRVRSFPEHLLVLLGISKLWNKPDWDPVLMRSGQDFVKSDDTSDVVFTDAQAAEGDDAVARGSEQRFEDVGYVSVPNVKGFTKTAAPKALTRHSARRLKSAAQSTSSDPVELSDDIEVSEGQGPDVEKEKKLVGFSFKDANVCADVLAHFAPLGVREATSEMEGDNMLSRLMLSSFNLSALVAEGVTHFRKGM
ncbi:hypothetical protein Hdeb2414_s0019g00544371 [Helianthus debilis subsp. tardiflorus]